MASVSPIVLLTDFGLADPYAGLLHGVITSRCRRARIIDLCHGIEPQNIVQGAAILEGAYSFFPPGSIFVCVVDPGVGTPRKILCARTRRYYFIGPDNGILSPALRREIDVEIRSIENDRYYGRRPPAATFHGRDIMAPVAAALARSGPQNVFSKLGPKIKSFHLLKWPPIRKSPSSIVGTILFFDHFGNAMTNIKRNDAPPEFWRKAEARVKGAEAPIQENYGEGKRRLIALFNSGGTLELAVASGSARRAAGLKAGDRIEVLIK